MDRIAMLEAMEVWHQALVAIAMRDDCPPEIRATAAIAVAQGSAFIVTRPDSLDKCAVIIDHYTEGQGPSEGS